MTRNDTFFRPFVGKDYTTGGMFARRIMVLGESHYCDEGCADCGNPLTHKECASFTDSVVKAHLNENGERENWMRTFVKFERSLVGRDTDPALRRRIWESLLFYNYLQTAMGGPRKAGTAAQYQEAGKALFEVMEKYRPERIIVWGQRLWERLPSEQWEDGTELLVEGQKVATGSYALSGGERVRVMAVYHPSVGYAWDFWHKAIEQFLR